VPLTLAAARVSIALPCVVILYLLSFVTFRLLCCKCPYAASIALGMSALSVPQLLSGHVGATIISVLDGNNFGLRTLEQRQALAMELQEGPVLHLVNISNATVMSQSEARLVAKRVLQLTDFWDIALTAAKGIPFFTLGVRYAGSFSGGRFRSRGTLNESALIWKEFGSFFEHVRAALSRELHAPARLHPRLPAPQFLIWLPTVVNNFHTDLHRDALLGEVPAVNVLTQHFAFEGISACQWEKQLTLVVALQAPRSGEHTTSFAVDLLRYKGDVDWCPDNGTALVECIDIHTVAYTEGGFLLFPSLYLHASTPWGHGFSDIRPRIIVTAFVVPCEAHGALEYQILSAWR